MICRHRIPCLVGLLPILAGLPCGCGPSTPPVAEVPPPPVTVSTPLLREIVDQDDYEGRIAAEQTVEVRARVRGHLVKIHFKDGQSVNEHDPLFEIDPRSYQAALDAANAQLSSADANLELAKKEYARYALLAARGAATKEEVDVWTAKQLTASADRLKALAAVEQAQLDLDFTKVAAPIKGRTSRTQVTIGNLINAGGGETLLTTLVSVDPMYVYFDVDERALLRYRRVFSKPTSDGAAETTVKDLKIPVQVGLEGETGYPHKGMLDFADNRVNPSTGTIQVRGVLPNPKRILDAGMRARVRIPIGAPYKALLVTERAIGTDQGRKFVYIVNDQNVAERRDVTLDRIYDGLVVVREGVKATDRVIVNGIQRVRDGATVEPRPGPMPGTPAESASSETKK